MLVCTLKLENQEEAIMEELSFPKGGKYKGQIESGEMVF